MGGTPTHYKFWHLMSIDVPDVPDEYFFRKESPINCRKITHNTPVTAQLPSGICNQHIFFSALRKKCSKLFGQAQNTLVILHHLSPTDSLLSTVDHTKGFNWEMGIVTTDLQTSPA